MAKDKVRQQIERTVNAPMISCDWGANTIPDGWEPSPTPSGLLLPDSVTKNGLIDEWRKVKDVIRARRSKSSTDSEMHEACEKALALVAFITKAGECGAITGNWRPSHEILRDVAEECERRTGRIDPLVQAVIREAMDQVMVEERIGK
jgi:hypothetical protein